MNLVRAPRLIPDYLPTSLLSSYTPFFFPKTLHLRRYHVFKMDSIVNLILNRSVVTVEHIKITKATPEYVLLPTLTVV